VIPVLAIIRVRVPKGGFSLWAPVILLWLLGAVVALILSPLLFAFCLARRRNPFAVAAGVTGVVCSLRGVNVDVEAPAASVQVRLI
jgi:hypothetical protein